MKTIEQMVARNPRFCVATPDFFKISIERNTEDSNQVCSAELMDISRQGVRIKIQADIVEGDQIHLTMEAGEENIKFASGARVQWAATVGGGYVMAGCLLKNEIDWELMGELFLTGALIPEED